MSALGERFLTHHLALRPVDGTFMGRRQCDAHWPRADRQASADELRSIAAITLEAAQTSEEGLGDRLDKKIVQGELALAAASLRERPRFTNPAWYSGEAVFGVVGLLLPQAAPLHGEALSARLKSLPDFLADGRAQLAHAGAAPRGWVERARREALAFADFLRTDFDQSAAAGALWRADAERAAASLAEFAAALADLADCDPRCGEHYLNVVIRDVHGLADAEALAAEASAAFERLGAELSEDAARLASGCSWREAIDSLSAITPGPTGVLTAYGHWQAAAVNASRRAHLVTPAEEYDLEYRWMAPEFRRLAADTYFLYYRSPPAFNAGGGSVYWVNAAGADSAAYLRGQNIATLKTTHTVHHGSIGHHTQNARARTSPGLLTRIAGTDCAAGIALLSAGTMVEGWACYAEGLLSEAEEFYSPAERLLLKHNERRNAASVMVDVNLHLKRWSIAQAEQFYRDAGFPPQRVASEIVRNSMFPGSRLMYRAGVEAIKALRRSCALGARAFHDHLLSFGHVPIAVAAAEMQRAAPP